MSRLPQPSSSSSRPGGVRTRLQSTPSTPIRSPVTPLAKPRAKTPAPAASPAPTTTHTLRPQQSLKSLKAKPPTAKSPAKRPQPLPPAEPPADVPQRPQLSIREQIALKRAEAKKLSTSPAKEAFATPEDASPHTHTHTHPHTYASAQQAAAQDVDLGRWSVKETIERGRSSGAINLSSRDLPCLPSALFEIHLGIKPEPLQSVTVEPPITTSTAGAPARKPDAPSWYDAQDLEILKAWSNEIVEIQPEISMFGSLKTVDLHNNKLASLPDAFADLTALTHLDLSHNHLTALPPAFWALPHLATLNLSHNALTALPFDAPFTSSPTPTPLARTKDPRGDWFSQPLTRATEPLPRLVSLDASHNPLPASAISPALPALLAKLSLAETPLGKSAALLRALARLERLKELVLARADIADDSFPPSLFACASGGRVFPALQLLDLEETHATRPALEAALAPHALAQTLQFDTAPHAPPDGVLVLRVVVGRRVVKEPWEIEAERTAKRRAHAHAHAAVAEAQAQAHGGVAAGMGMGTGAGMGMTREGHGRKEQWELEAEQGLLTEGAKRRARAQALAAASSASASASVSAGAGAAGEGLVPASAQTTAPKPKVVQKEPWEIELEQGMYSAGARRRARAAAVAALSASASASAASSAQAIAQTPTQPSAPRSAQDPQQQQHQQQQARPHTPATLAAALAHPHFYDAASRTLTLPPSAPPRAAPHARSFSLAASSPFSSSSSPFSLSPAHTPAHSPTTARDTHAHTELALAIPAPTLPLAALAAQPLAHTLTVLVLARRRADPSFSLPFPFAPAPAPAEGAGAGALPSLEELSLADCALGDGVPVSVAAAPASAGAPDAEGEGGERDIEREREREGERERERERRTREPILALIARLFPSLRTLDLSYNALTAESLAPDALALLLFAAPAPASAPAEHDAHELDPHTQGTHNPQGAHEHAPGAPAPGARRGLRHLRLRGNRLGALDGLEAVAERFRGHREVPGWALEELDVRDNAVARVPPALGLLPLEVFLVDGNPFRVPPRRVWEREGTKGLLSWLRGRIE